MGLSWNRHEDVHPCIHYEIRQSLSQLCGVKKKKKMPPLQLLSSGQRAPHSFGAESPSQSGAQQRGLAPSWCRRLRRRSDSDGFALVRLFFYCGDCRMREATTSVSSDTFHKFFDASSSTFSPAFGCVSVAQASLCWSEEKLCTTSDAAASLALRTSRKPCLLSCAPFPISPGFDPLSVTTPRTCR